MDDLPDFYTFDKIERGRYWFKDSWANILPHGEDEGIQYFRIGTLWTPPESRRMGQAATILEGLSKAADNTGVALVVKPVGFSPDSPSANDLYRMYQRRGFRTSLKGFGVGSRVRLPKSQ